MSTNNDMRDWLNELRKNLEKEYGYEKLDEDKNKILP